MKKHKLADELRQRQYIYGMAPRHLIDALNDDQIIDSYITCSCCGEKSIDLSELETAIEKAQNAEEFIDLACGSYHDDISPTKH